MKPPTYEGTKALSARVNEPEASHQTERYRVGGGPLTHDLLAVPHRDAEARRPGALLHKHSALRERDRQRDGPVAAACSRFRAGTRVPHPRHWMAFVALVEEGLD